MKILLVLVLLSCLPAPAFSAGNIHFKELEIHPYLSVTETYDDNVYATSSDTKNDWITTTTPGIKLLMPFKTHSFAAEYRASFFNYLDYTDENVTDQHAAALADFKFASLIGLKLGDTYDRGHEPRAASGSGEIVEYDKNAAKGELSYVFADRFKAQMDYTRTYLDFSSVDNEFRNRSEDLIATYLYYRFMPKTSAFVEYDFKNVSYELEADGLDNQVQKPLLGLTWEISEMTKGTVKGGYLFKNYEEESTDNIDTWTASAELDHEFNENSSIKVVGLREVNEPNVKGTTYYITTGAFTEYTHKLMYKVSAVARGSYGADDYNNAAGTTGPDRNDKTFLGGVGLKYQLRDWLEFDLNYNHLDRNSNISTYDLQDNTVSFGVKFAM
jgi:hypothetical protein